MLRCSTKAAIPVWSAKLGVANSDLENKLVWSYDGVGENVVRNVPMDFLFVLFYYLNSVNRMNVQWEDAFFASADVG